MSQTKTGSVIEAIANIAVGLGVALGSQLIAFAWVGIKVPITTNLWMTAWFTAVSLVRSYVIRRWFNHRLSTNKSKGSWVPNRLLGAGSWHWVPDKIDESFREQGASGEKLSKDTVGSTGLSLHQSVEELHRRYNPSIRHSIKESFDY